MPKLTETFVSKLPLAEDGPRSIGTRRWGLVLFLGKAAKTWCFQKDVGGQTGRVMIGRYPARSASAACETALEFMLEWGREAGKSIQIGAPNLGTAISRDLPPIG